MLTLDDGEEVARLGSRSRQSKNDSGASQPGIRADRSAGWVAFGGLALELTGDADGCARLDRAARAGLPEPDASDASAITRSAITRSADAPAPKFAARCRLQIVPAPAIGPEVPPSGLAWEWTDRGGELLTRFGGARVWPAPEELGGRDSVEGPAFDATAAGSPAFEATAWLAADARAPHHLLGGLAVMLTHRLGGGVFHAASVQLDGAVVAFVGPSGAGKSTACRHVSGAPLVSVDRLALVPQGSRWLSHPLPGGTRPVPDMPYAPAAWRPLAAILRVQKATAETAISAPGPALALALLRESTFQTGLQPSAERELLAALDDLVQHVPVARLELRLGASLGPLLRRWLKSQAEERG